ncbi:Retrotransposon Copia-like [Theobroma cacao]|nr:Retrotransposon Copia-like [Theobroma cacao]
MAQAKSNDSVSINTQIINQYDFLSPYALHPFDNLSIPLISCIFKEENYATWRRAMTNALLAKNKFGAAFVVSKSNTKSASTCVMARIRDTSMLYCDYCKKNRHTRETCFELHGYPNWGEKNKSKLVRGKSANNTKIMETTKNSTGSPINGLFKE